MSNVIELIERMGSEVSLQNSANLKLALNEHNIDESLQKAILDGDVKALEKELNVRGTIFCGVAPAEDDEPEETEETEDNKLTVNI